MGTFPYIDIHTHHAVPDRETVKVVNLYPGDAIPAFRGNNFYSVGLHPWKLKSENENNSFLQMMEDALEFDHVIFAGECGLDKITGADFEEQKRVFTAQALLAEEYGKPLIIHCVRAYNEVLEIYNNLHPPVPWMLHGYVGSPEMTRQLSGKHFLFSFGKILLRDNAKVIESFRELPLNKIFLETDEYDGPVKDIFQRASELRSCSVEEIQRVVWENFNRLENVDFEWKK